MTISGSLGVKSARAGESEKAVKAEAKLLTPLFEAAFKIKESITKVIDYEAVNPDLKMMSQEQKNTANAFFEQLNEIPAALSRGDMLANAQKKEDLKGCYNYEGVLEQTPFKNMVIGGETRETEALEDNAKTLQKNLQAIQDALDLYNKRLANTSGTVGVLQAKERVNEMARRDLDAAFNGISKAIEDADFLDTLEELEKHVVLARTYGETRKIMARGGRPDMESVPEAAAFLSGQHLGKQGPEIGLQKVISAAQERAALRNQESIPKKEEVAEKEAAREPATEIVMAKVWGPQFAENADVLKKNIQNMKDSPEEIEKTNTAILLFFGAAHVALEEEFGMSAEDAMNVRGMLDDINRVIAEKAKDMGKKVVQRDITEDYKRAIRDYINEQIDEVEGPIKKALSDMKISITGHYNLPEKEVDAVISTHKEDLLRKLRKSRRDYKATKEVQKANTFATQSEVSAKETLKANTIAAQSGINKEQSRVDKKETSNPLYFSP
jgi:hypothetical protein